MFFNFYQILKEERNKFYKFSSIDRPFIPDHYGGPQPYFLLKAVAKITVATQKIWLLLLLFATASTINVV